MKKVAVLVDGGFFRKRANVIYGDLTPEELAGKMIQQCHDHVTHKGKQPENELYRIFYYDCPPLDKKVVHPLTHEQVDYSKLTTTKDTQLFFDILEVILEYDL